jgi:FKBP-type peptidyl-prolyl cis-trans isomerase
MGKLVPGLQEVLQMMPEGSKWQIVLPTGTAAGGRDPLDDTGALIYEMELLSVIAVQ